MNYKLVSQAEIEDYFKDTQDQVVDFTKQQAEIVKTILTEKKLKIFEDKEKKEQLLWVYEYYIPEDFFVEIITDNVLQKVILADNEGLIDRLATDTVQRVQTYLILKDIDDYSWVFVLSWVFKSDDWSLEADIFYKCDQLRGLKELLLKIKTPQ